MGASLHARPCGARAVFHIVPTSSFDHQDCSSFGGGLPNATDAISPCESCLQIFPWSQGSSTSCSGLHSFMFLPCCRVCCLRGEVCVPEGQAARVRDVHQCTKHWGNRALACDGGVPAHL